LSFVSYFTERRSSDEGNGKRKRNVCICIKVLEITSSL